MHPGYVFLRLEQCRAAAGLGRELRRHVWDLVGRHAVVHHVVGRHAAGRWYAWRGSLGHCCYPRTGSWWYAVLWHSDHCPSEFRLCCCSVQRRRRRLPRQWLLLSWWWWAWLPSLSWHSPCGCSASSILWVFFFFFLTAMALSRLSAMRGWERKVRLFTSGTKILDQQFVPVCRRPYTVTVSAGTKWTTTVTVAYWYQSVVGPPLSVPPHVRTWVKYRPVTPKTRPCRVELIIDNRHNRHLSVSGYD